MCSKFSHKIDRTLMADLPEESALIPKKHSGRWFGVSSSVFFEKKTRCETFKIHTAHFICFVSEAVPLEVKSQLTTQICCAALGRFMTRRDCPADNLSDNGLNCIGSIGELEE